MEDSKAPRVHSGGTLSKDDEGKQSESGRASKAAAATSRGKVIDDEGARILNRNVATVHSITQQYMLKESLLAALKERVGVLEQDQEISRRQIDAMRIHCLDMDSIRQRNSELELK
jgi:hypothetical protein